MDILTKWTEAERKQDEEKKILTGKNNRFFVLWGQTIGKVVMRGDF